jgi:hypothetical protein
VPYWIHAKVKDSSFSVVVETAKDALSKLAELADLGHTEVIAKDLLGKVIDAATLRAETE